MSQFEASPRVVSEFSFKQLKLDHPSFPPFMGEGKCNSNIDKSAFDRCLKEILCTELFKSGIDGSALLLIE